MEGHTPEQCHEQEKEIWSWQGLCIIKYDWSLAGLRLHLNIASQAREIVAQHLVVRAAREGKNGRQPWYPFDVRVLRGRGTPQWVADVTNHHLNNHVDFPSLSRMPPP